MSKGNHKFTCEICSTEFYRWAYQRARFCSRACLYKHQRLNPNKGTFIYTSKSGSAHHNWKEQPPYRTLHDWVQWHKGKASSCEFCGVEKAKFEWANISKKYKRDLDDYISLCKSCHMKYDKHPWIGVKNGQTA